MKKPIKSWSRAAWQAIIFMFAVVGLGMASTTKMPTPGSVNFLQGQVTLDGSQLPAQVSSAVLEADQVLQTQQGKAEVLLTPGVFLRVGEESAVKMISPDLANTRVAVTKGSAILEVDELFNENNLVVLEGNTRTRIEQKGLYEFNANESLIRVLDGKATVYEGDAGVTLKKGHEVAFASDEPLKAQKFDRNAVEANSLYRWSQLRSEYEAQANLNAAQTVVVYGGWYGPGWYWAPFWGYYSFLPANGILYSPFGWGFYSPIFLRRFAYSPHVGGPVLSAAQPTPRVFSTMRPMSRGRG
jgi:hypothetical protein